MQVDIPAPDVLMVPIVVKDKAMMGPGPSNISPRVRHAMGLPMMGLFHEETSQILDDVKAGLQYLFQTTNTMTLAISASGHGAMEAAMCNLIERGDVVLMMDGYWGERTDNMAKRYGARVEILEQTPGTHSSLDVIEVALKKHGPVLFFVTHGDSSTGVRQPLEGLGPLCHKYDCLLVVDTVASLGGVPVFTDRWEIDVIYTGSQKVLACSPGFAPISFSPRAVKKMESRTTPASVFYFDMKLLGEYWSCFADGKPRVYHHTVPVSLLYGLREALAIVAEEGIENSWERHRLCAEQLHSGLARLGLELLVEREDVRLATVTTVILPEGVDWKRLQKFANDKYLVEVSGGLGPLLGRIIRIGIMGYNATPSRIEQILAVLKEGIEYIQNNKSEL